MLGVSGYCGKDGLFYSQSENEDVDDNGDITFDQLSDLADQSSRVDSHQNSKFFFIKSLEKANRTDKSEEKKTHFLGWKLRISVDLWTPGQLFDPLKLGQVFDLIEPILTQYGFCFLVTNPDKMCSQRFLQGGQFTVFLEESEKVVQSPEVVLQMVMIINEMLLKNDIGIGVKPDSDAQTISPYCSLRNDKNIDFTGDNGSYIFASQIGRNFNPRNNPNPFSSLLYFQPDAFDPLAHFGLFDADITSRNLVTDELFCLTALLVVWEHIDVESMDSAEQQIWIADNCLSDDTTGCDAASLAAKYAVTLLTMFRVGRGSFHKYIQSAQLSAHYPFDNTFKEFLMLLENYSRQPSKELFSPHEFGLLTDRLLGDAMDLIEQISQEFWDYVLKNGHFYHALAVLCLTGRRTIDSPDYEELLERNRDIPAAQYERSKWRL